MHKIIINGVEYSNIGTIVPEIEREYWYNVKTRSGKVKRKLRYIRTNYKVTFFNALDGKYTDLRDYINEEEDNSIRCGFPNDEDGFDYDYYYLTVESETNKGYLNNGNYYKNAMSVSFEQEE